jgi:hypothetical protein
VEQPWTQDSVGETPTDATETVALPEKSLMIGGLQKRAEKPLDLHAVPGYPLACNEYFEPATVAWRAASTLRGGRGLNFRSQDFSNPTAETGGGVFGLYRTTL